MSQINNSESAFSALKNNFNPFCEEFWLICLNSQLEQTQCCLISKGTLNFCLVHPRDLFRVAIQFNSFALIIAHNHPSLNTLPSPEDIKLTNRLVKCSQLLEVPILDHLIFTDTEYFSFKKNDLL